MSNKFVMFFKEITKWVDEGSLVEVIHLDFQIAFDKVPHQRLILKLKAHGMENSIINWIEQWLTDRRQRVVVDGDLTRFNKIATQGAPQMAVDKEANSLSRVYSYYSKFNLRLFYM